MVTALETAPPRLKRYSIDRGTVVREDVQVSKCKGFRKEPQAGQIEGILVAGRISRLPFFSTHTMNNDSAKNANFHR